MGMNVPTFAKDILAQTHSPTSRQLLNFLKKFPTTNPWRSSGWTLEGFYDRKGIGMIAALEKAYPGAQWAPLGRDAAIAADYLDAFYTVNGYSDRVTRLRASGGTLVKAGEKEIIRFLESAGANFDPADKTARPFIILDRTSFGKESQSTLLLKNAFAEWKRRGGEAEAFPYRFGVVDLMPRHEMLTDVQNDPRSLLYEQGRVLASGGEVSDLRIFSVAGLMDGPEWHETYGALARHKDGFYGIPGRPVPDRRRVLAVHYEFLKSASSEGFLPAVKNAGAQMGHMVDFQGIRPYQPSTRAESEQYQIKRIELFLQGKIDYWYSWSSDDDILTNFLDKNFRSQHQALFNRLIEYPDFQKQWVLYAKNWLGNPNNPDIPDKKQIIFYIQEILANKPDRNFMNMMWVIFDKEDLLLKNPVVQEWFLQVLRHSSLVRYTFSQQFKKILRHPRLFSTKSGRSFFLALVPHIKGFEFNRSGYIFEALEQSRYWRLAKWNEGKFSVRPYEMIAKNKRLSRDFIEGKNSKVLCEAVLSRL